MSEDSKTINIKQRLIGAIVLISLGIIFIPLLFNGGEELQEIIRGTTIPSLPEKLEKVARPVPQTPPKPVIKPVYIRPVDNFSEPEGDSTSHKQVKEKSAKIVTTQPIIPASDFKKAPAPKTTKINTSYTIQVASFSNKNNAFSLQKKLRKSGFRAYIESVSTSKGKYYRVRVGPYLKYNDVIKVQKQIIKKYKLKAAIIKYDS